MLAYNLCLLRADARRKADMQSVLSYFRSYFDPRGHAPYENHSTGQIAKHLHALLSNCGPVTYFGSKERPEGLRADLFVGHFWAFADLCRRNSFQRRIAFYSVSDPVQTRALLHERALDFGVPEELWDLPPDSFDHEATMDIADTVLVVGNSYTLATFPQKWHHKIRLVNYSVDTDLYRRATGVQRRNEFCYVATNCGLRKGFMDVLRTWSGIGPGASRLHAIGRLYEPWTALLAKFNTGSIVHHGWIDSHTVEYLRLLQSCRYAYIPTYSEGQMGSLLEAIHSGCVPITTRASGLDDAVLAHCIVVDPLDIDQHRRVIHNVLAWPNETYEARRLALASAVRARQNWDIFDRGVAAALWPPGL